jgi:hypothetical protein
MIYEIDKFCPEEGMLGHNQTDARPMADTIRPE